MGKSLIQTIWHNERRFLMYFRYLLIYLVFVLLALCTNVYETGFVPNNLFTALVIMGLIVYRFLTFAVLPAIITYWLLSKGYENATRR